MSDAPTEQRFLESLGKSELQQSTDDVLARTLPLLDQVLALHDHGLVAPLEGVDDLYVTAGRIWFENGKGKAPRTDAGAVRRVSAEESRAFDVVARYRDGEEDGETQRRQLRIGEPGKGVERPVYMPRYLSWEHELGHHDALTDIFVLGLVLASVALDRNLGDPETIRDLAGQRTRLREQNERLHPVLLRAIVHMTELDRHARAQDLRAIIATLRSYREQPLDVELPTAESTTGSDRDRSICRALRDRLFDFTRRNRLLHFRPTGQTLNLTASSVPLVVDVRNVDPESLFTWTGRAAADVVAQKPLALGRYLRFEDYPFLGAALDQIRLEAKQKLADLGVSQLRLAICFLHWTDLKESKEERITSPLVLLPVTLEKKKGVRDAHVLCATDDHAEVNPVLRQYLAQRYGITLPEEVDLSATGSLDALYDTLVAQVRASEPGVTLERVTKPRIDLVLAQARQRIEAYRKRVALSGRSARTAFGFDYSYARGKVHPLGVQLFHHLVMPPDAPERVLHEAPRPVVSRVAPAVVTKELYALREGAAGVDAYTWRVDFAHVTLANFNYRKMSLVRDYAQLIETGETNTVFDGLFSREPRNVTESPPPLPWAERHDVVEADPTQATAIARARRGESFIIQGPPGTGKSQTIANLVADAVGRGKRVLFVAEKLAAIDVVHHRLSRQGLGPLACLIHDTQNDKKAFLADLKETYEGWIAKGASDDARRGRERALTAFAERLGRAEGLFSAMREPPRGGEESLHAVVRHAIGLGDARPAESVLNDPALPSLRAFRAAAAELGAIEAALRATGSEPVLARHPARLLGRRVLNAELPAQAARAVVADLRPALDRLAASGITTTGKDRDLRAVLLRHAFLLRTRLLLDAGALALLDATKDLAVRFRRGLAELDARTGALRAAEQAAAGWKRLLSRDDVGLALTQAKAFQASFLSRAFGWLMPSWWRLRRVMTEHFEFASSAIRLSWVQALERASARYEAESAEALTRSALAAEVGVGDVDAARSLVEELGRPGALGPIEVELRDAIIAAGGTTPAALLAAANESPDLAARIAASLTAYEPLSPAELSAELARIEQTSDVVPALARPLAALATADASVDAFARRVPVTARGLESAVYGAAARATLAERATAILDGAMLGDLHGTLDLAGADLRAANAAAMVETVRQRFLDDVRLSAAPTDTLTREQKERKKLYSQGRKELEHELGKVMRHKSIRDVVAGKSGIVVRDLKPIWLMSPLSVADTLPLAAEFDLVIFDEASQIPLEDAVPAIHRAGQCIVVGDEMQLPPTDFFTGSAVSDDDLDEPSEASGWDLDAPSLLGHATRTLPSTMLGWHYRSRDESLITFSNHAFYAGRLYSVPSTRLRAASEPIVARAATDGVAGAASLLSRPLSFHRMEGAVYEQRQNPFEATYIAELVRALLAKGTGRTIGIVAFSEAQQTEIDSAIHDLAEDDAEFRARWEEEVDRVEEGQHVGAFVKNLENVQGDERDIIIVSVCYAPDAKGRMIMNFGPINKSGGEKRLNVIFSRAKHHLAVVSTISWPQITNEHNDGASCLRNYLRYAEATSRGDSLEARLALSAYGALAGRRETTPSDLVTVALADALRARGFTVETDVGASGLRCGIALHRPGDDAHRLGVLIDDDDFYRAGPDEAVRIRPAVLRAFGWRVATVTAAEWMKDPARVVARIAGLVESAVPAFIPP